jgi:hypothetical protein
MKIWEIREAGERIVRGPSCIVEFQIGCAELRVGARGNLVPTGTVEPCPDRRRGSPRLYRLFK